MLSRIRILLPLLCTLVLFSACSDDDPVNPGVTGQVPDFSLMDVNPTSATFDKAVSPRDHLEMVSAWYFGHAT